MGLLVSGSNADRAHGTGHVHGGTTEGSELGSTVALKGSASAQVAVPLPLRTGVAEAVRAATDHAHGYGPHALQTGTRIADAREHARAEPRRGGGGRVVPPQVHGLHENKAEFPHTYSHSLVLEARGTHYTHYRYTVSAICARLCHNLKPK